MAKQRRHGSGSIRKRGETWSIKYYSKGVAVYESSHSRDKKDAEALLRKRLSEVASGRFAGLGPERVTIAELLQDVLDDYKLQKRATWDDAESRIRLHLNPYFGATKAAEFSTDSVKRYVTARRVAEAEDGTINRELALLRRAFNLALQCDPPKVMRTVKILRLREDNVRTGFVEVDQYRALRDALPEYVRLIFVVGYHTGMRVGELRKIKWSQVDLKARELKLEGPQTKNRKPRTVPIYGDMFEWLSLAKDARDAQFPGCSWVFSNHGDQIGDFRRGWESATKAVGLPSLLFHDLRRSAVRNMERAGIPRKVAMAISGHRTEAVYSRYDIVSAKDLRVAGSKLEAYLSETPADSGSEIKARPN